MFLPSSVNGFALFATETGKIRLELMSWWFFKGGWISHLLFDLGKEKLLVGKKKKNKLKQIMTQMFHLDNQLFSKVNRVFPLVGKQILTKKKSEQVRIEVWLMWAYAESFV